MSRTVKSMKTERRLVVVKGAGGRNEGEREVTATMHLGGSKGEENV